MGKGRRAEKKVEKRDKRELWEAGRVGFREPGRTAHHIRAAVVSAKLAWVPGGWVGWRVGWLIDKNTKRFGDTDFEYTVGIGLKTGCYRRSWGGGGSA